MSNPVKTRSSRKIPAAVVILLLLLEIRRSESFSPVQQRTPRVSVAFNAPHLQQSKRPLDLSRLSFYSLCAKNAKQVDDASSSQPLKWKRVLIPKEEQPPIEPHEGMTTADKLGFAATTVTAALLFTWLVKSSGPGGWRYYLAGGICAAVSHCVPVPIDVVKTKKQVDPALYRLSFMDAMKSIVEKDGMWALMAGLGPTFWGYLLEGSIKFGVYEVLKPVFQPIFFNISQLTPYLAFMQTQIPIFMACATVSGLAASFMLCPMEALRIRMVSETDFAPAGMKQGLLKMLKYEGLFALWKGFTPMIAKQIPYTVTKNVSFDLITKAAYASALSNGVALNAQTKLAVPFVAAMLASVLSCVSSQPGDLILSIVNAHGGRRKSRDVLHDILRSKRGVKGFFLGFKTRLLHVGIIVTLQLLIYDFVKRLCGIAATGSV